MKKVFLTFLALALVLCAGTAVWAIVEGTPHDVNVMRDGTGLEICAMCHTPHAADAQNPLWNRSQTVPTYDMYTSDTFDMVDATATVPGSVSALCMVCHNGVASTLVNYPGPANVNALDLGPSMMDFGTGDAALRSSFTNLGTDMANDHPISFKYDPALDDVTDANGFPAAILVSTGTKNRMMIPGTGANYPLYGAAQDRMECATCHSVHHTAAYNGPLMDNGISAGTQVFFLRTDNADSMMCTDCHTNR